jgi:hypothetical protein
LAAPFHPLGVTELSVEGEAIIKPPSPDTRPAAEQVQTALLQQAPPWRKLELAVGLNRMLYMLAGNQVRRHHREASPGRVRRHLAELWLGPALAARVGEAWLHRSDRSDGGSMATDVLAVTVAVIDELEALGIPYALGGSLASSVHGVPRSTMDADIVADVREEHVEPTCTGVEQRILRRRRGRA